MKVFWVEGVVEEGAGNDVDVAVFEVTLEVFANDETMAKEMVLEGYGIERGLGKVTRIEEKGEIDDSLVSSGIKIAGVTRIWEGLYNSPDNPYKEYEAL